MTIPIYALGLVCGLVSYWCSRGHDGKLFEALIGFSAITVVFSVLITRRENSPRGAAALDFLLYKVCIISAMLIKSELEEMVGMFY